MSRRGHYRNFNVNELAEALTRNGWQPPATANNGYPMMNRGTNGNQLAGNLAALSNLLGSMNGGGFPAVNGIPMPSGTVPPLQAGMPPQLPAMPNIQQNPPSAPLPPPVSDTDLLKNLFQQIIKMLAKE